ncbi:hypothetical protein [Variovorax paradoxus]|uniref:hypothetical protein n=1 Tax=Variovorax paradoxus TaxID=34073 RepID=UPI00247FF2D7|nr:hypothetical protein [Variovorax paradoxus]WGT62418.1 hypothetical protein QHG62_20480 [Variovorax paradoxus]
MDGDTAHCSKEKCHAHAEFERIAVKLGLVQAGEAMDPALLAYGLRVAELCASIGDHYSSVGKGNAGEHIRSVYGARGTFSTKS